MPASLMAAGAVCLLVAGRAAAHCAHPLRRMLGCAVCGAGGLAAVALLEPITGVSLPLNGFTCAVAGILGLPGVILLLVLNVL